MLISNPLHNPLFGPSLLVVLGLLGGALLLLVLGTRGNLARLRGSVLFRRWQVWTVIAVIYGGALLGGALQTRSRQMRPGSPSMRASTDS